MEQKSERCLPQGRAGNETDGLNQVEVIRSYGERKKKRSENDAGLPSCRKR